MLVLAQSTWTMLLAVVVRVTSQNVPVALLSDVIVILKMLELDVKVNYNTAILSFFINVKYVPLDIIRHEQTSKDKEGILKC